MWARSLFCAPGFSVADYRRGVEIKCITGCSHADVNTSALEGHADCSQDRGEGQQTNEFLDQVMAHGLEMVAPSEAAYGSHQRPEQVWSRPA